MLPQIASLNGKRLFEHTFQFPPARFDLGSGSLLLGYHRPQAVNHRLQANSQLGKDLDALALGQGWELYVQIPLGYSLDNVQ
jgi:hypothetical protein